MLLWMWAATASADPPPPNPKAEPVEAQKPLSTASSERAVAPSPARRVVAEPSTTAEAIVGCERLVAPCFTLPDARAPDVPNGYAPP